MTNFQIKDDIFYESLPVCDYLDEVYPGRKLQPETPEGRVKDKMVIAHYDTVNFLKFSMGKKFCIIFSRRLETITKFCFPKLLKKEMNF